MKKIVLAFAVFTGAFLMSCNNNKKQTSVSEVEVIEPTVTVTPDDNLERSTINDKNGNTLEVTFDNARGTAIAYLNGDTITMTQDTTASGVRLHNDAYLYEEWQGHVVLKKDGKVVFDNKK